MSNFDMILLFVWAQVILIPILGGIWLGMRNENNRRRQLLDTALKALFLASRRRQK